MNLRLSHISIMAFKMSSCTIICLLLNIVGTSKLNASKLTCKHLVCDGYKCSNIRFLRPVLNSERELVFLKACGNVFHNFDAEY